MKPVAIAVLEESSKQIRFSTLNKQHYKFAHPANHSCGDGGYNRRASLLEYSRRLQTAARSETSSRTDAESEISRFLLPIAPKEDNITQHNTREVVALRRNRPKHATTPACLGNWKTIVPSFLRPIMVSQNKKNRKKNNRFPTMKMMKAVLKSFQVQEKSRFLHKFFASLRKRP